ncbi:hypothetical protein EU803_05305 [Loktanella sp. IMCC34160]|uniref:hypothetical protein n=1 Tax=Loktanella sp. IMCC34160 TaxID=2510646 RepID=UPI00101E06D3|nr:hypothetical protein [Loktanella sp. IMCC34160]RYG91873.1 hypothetical protein EU803_05305 [Loktanella sp. IMCC34160]
MAVQFFELIKASAASLTDRFMLSDKSDDADLGPRPVVRDVERENAKGRKELDSLRSALYPQEAA